MARTGTVNTKGLTDSLQMTRSPSQPVPFLLDLTQPSRLLRLVSFLLSERQPALWGLELWISQVVTPDGNMVFNPPLSGRSCQDNVELWQEKHFGRVGFQGTGWRRLEIVVRTVDRQPVMDGDRGGGLGESHSSSCTLWEGLWEMGNSLGTEAGIKGCFFFTNLDDDRCCVLALGGEKA